MSLEESEVFDVSTEIFNHIFNDFKVNRDLSRESTISISLIEID